MIITLTQQGREPLISRPTTAVQNLTGLILWLYNNRLLPKQDRDRKRILKEISSLGVGDTDQKQTYICRFARSVPASSWPGECRYALTFDPDVTVVVEREPAVLNVSRIVICPYCEGRAVLVDSAEVYSRSYGMIWLCRPCGAYVGVHKGSPSAEPKGTLAKPELRLLRKQAHEAFDPLWISGGMSRVEAYRHLQEIMDLSPDEAHIGRFNVEQCRTLIDRLKAGVLS